MAGGGGEGSTAGGSEAAALTGVGGDRARGVSLLRGKEGVEGEGGKGNSSVRRMAGPRPSADAEVCDVERGEGSAGLWAR